MQNKDRVSIFIDGSNFYHKLKDKEINAKDILKFNYRGLADWLARDRNIAFCGYYVGAIRAKNNDTQGQKLRQSQQKLFAHLLSPRQKFVIKTGYMMRNDGVYHEKGVDIHLAVDLLVGAYENTFDTAIIVSSDTDLIPVIEKVKSLRKKVEYIGFAHKPSLGLQRYATLSRLLIREEIERFSNQDRVNRKPDAKAENKSKGDHKKKRTP